MTLTDLLPMVRQLSAPDKLKLIRILAEELDTNEDISPCSCLSVIVSESDALLLLDINGMLSSR